MRYAGSEPTTDEEVSAARLTPRGTWAAADLQQLRDATAGLAECCFARDERQSLSGLQWTGDELELARARESLDAALLAKRGGAISDRNDGCQFDRGAAAGVAAGGSGAVGGQAPLDVGRPTAVEAAVGAPEQVDVWHAGGFVGGPR
jgi:hypothetical protein